LCVENGIRAVRNLNSYSVLRSISFTVDMIYTEQNYSPCGWWSVRWSVRT